MTELWQALELWPVRALLVGGAVLLAGRLLMGLSRQPARRATVGLTAVIVALLVIPLAALPGWLPVPVPSHPNHAEIVAEAKERPLEEVASPSDESAVGFDTGAASFAASKLEAPNVKTQEGVSESALAPSSPSQSSALESAEQGDEWLGVVSSMSVVAWVLAGYGLIAFVFLARLVIGQIGLMRVWRTAQSAPATAEQLFRELAADVCPEAVLRTSARASGPVCFGVVHPRVLVPASVIAKSDSTTLRCIFAHELGHLRRRDPLAGWILGLARAAYFVCPWLSSLRREVRLAQEHLADADAVRRAPCPAEYAELLIRMTRARPAPLGAAGVRGTSSELYRRVTMLMNSTPVEGRFPRRWAVLIGGGLAAFAIAAAGLYVQPRPVVAAEPEKKESPKPAAKPDAIKELIEKLKKDAGDDPEKAKQIEELEKSLKPKPADDPAPKTVKPLPAPPPIAFPNLDLPEDELLRQLMQEQEQMLRQLQQALGQLRQGGGGGFVLRGPMAGRTTGGGRLGVRVEKPSDVLASQLDLPNGQGLVCVDVPAQSNAGKMGIKPHDILLEVGGKPVPNDVQAFIVNLKDIKPDTPVDIVVLRKGKKETLKGVKIPEAKEVAEVPAPFFPQLPGIDAVPLPVPDVPLPPLPGGKGIGVVAGPGETVRVEQVNDAFTVFYSKNGIKVTITGSKQGEGPPKAESIEIDDNGKTTKAESIEKLPKEYQEVAKSALKAIK
jgi:beta-lactamase regulating signal transducer with metallopeptidase domain